LYFPKKHGWYGLFSPDESAGRYLDLAFTAEKAQAATGINVGDLFAAIGAVGLHFHFVEFCKGVACLAEIFYSFRGGFLFHYRTAYPAYLFVHDSLLLIKD
jgi:hypothetical protein